MSDELAIVNASAQQEASAKFQLASEWYAGLETLVIVSDEQQEQVAAVLRQVKTQLRALEEKRTEITVPLNAALRAVNDLFRAPRERFEAVEHLLKGKVADYLRSKQQANVAALQAASVAATPAQASEAIAQVAPVAPPQGVSVRTVWKFAIVDPDAVPRELCSPDAKKIAAAVQYSAQGIPAPIAGVQFHKEDVVAVRGK